MKALLVRYSFLAGSPWQQVMHLVAVLVDVLGRSPSCLCCCCLYGLFASAPNRTSSIPASPPPSWSRCLRFLTELFGRVRRVCACVVSPWVGCRVDRWRCEAGLGRGQVPDSVSPWRCYPCQSNLNNAVGILAGALQGDVRRLCPSCCASLCALPGFAPFPAVPFCTSVQFRLCDS